MSNNPYGSTAPTTYGMLLYQADQIRNTVNAAYNTLFSQNIAMSNNLGSAIDARYHWIIDRINRQTSEIMGQNGQLVNSVVNNVANQIGGISTRITQSENSIKSAVTIAVSNLGNQVKVSEIALQNKISDMTNLIITRMNANDGVILSKLDALIGIPSSVASNVAQQLNVIQNNIISAMNNSLNQTEQDIINGLSSKINVISGNVNSAQNAVINQMNAQFASVNSTLSGLQTQVQTIDQSSSPGFDLGSILSSATQIGNFFNGTGNLAAQFQSDITLQFGKLQEIFEKLQTNQYTSHQEFVSDLNGLGVAGDLTQTLWNIGKFLFMITYGMMQSYAPFVDNIKTLAQSQANNHLLSPHEYLTYYHKFGRSDEELKTYFNKLGYTDTDIDRLRLSSFGNVDVAMAKYLYMQQKIDEQTHDDFLRKNGLNDSVIHYLKETYFATPPVQDLITMAVREAFTPEIAELYGQYENYPELLTQHMEKWGISEEWSRALWAAHWKLPSPEQGFEMFHRGVIDKKQLEDLLRALDIMPNWREKLIQLNYVPLRLVDIRRFYQLGVINEEEIFKEFKARGYDDTHAGWAVEYTIKSTSEGSDIEAANRRLLSQTVIVKAYRTGRINHSDAIYALSQLKYTEQDAQLLLDLSTASDDIDAEEKVIEDNRKRLIKLATDGYAKRLINLDDATAILLQNGYTSSQVDLELGMTDYEQNELLKAQVLQHIGELYTSYQIDRDSAAVIMSARGFESPEINRALMELEVKRDFRSNMPTLATFQKWLKNGLIDFPFFANGLKGLGYADNFIELYAMEVTGAIAQ